MLIVSKDLQKGKLLDCTPKSLSETSHLEPPFNNPLQKPVCIGDMVIFENVVDEDLAKPIPTFFVNSSLSTENAPLIFLPTNSSFSDIITKNQALEEQARSLEGILLAEKRSDKKAGKSKKKETPISPVCCGECTSLRKEVKLLKNENAVLINQINNLNKEVNKMNNR
ncbi:predicted protein [Naegleria gruberi]|uniref:Predicted protein n=1 Tax=Naegleria gruberi TaxID=5762 RepID=D2VS16_NAEGR|nr:uncharacterized protein NAEGRDRAFT_71778 [Naegleria gruberi]EFC40341.1 predicted protein [Naegleria gruberi]|eukprot:XP_002673085.1 predicted protein [Naegleria gruberi strain NEG-M]